MSCIKIAICKLTNCVTITSLTWNRKKANINNGNNESIRKVWFKLLLAHFQRIFSIFQVLFQSVCFADNLFSKGIHVFALGILIRTGMQSRSVPSWVLGKQKTWKDGHRQAMAKKEKYHWIFQHYSYIYFRNF